MVVVGTISAASASAQSAQDVIKTAMERYERAVAGIDNYTLVQNAMGIEMTNYFEKTEVDGYPVFLPAEASEADTEHSDVLRNLHQYAERMKLDGEEMVGERRCYVLSLEDFSGMDIGMDAEQGDFQPRRGTFYIDTDEYLMRRMRMEGDLAMNGQIHQTTMIAELQDWRTVEGMPHPFKTSISIQGIPTPDISQEDLEKAQKAMADLEKQMKEMPESQRNMMQSMMGPQLERLQQIIQSGSMAFEVEVKELRVNTGPPQGP